MLLDLNKVEEIISNALKEDIGNGDITSNLTIPDDAQVKAKFIVREDAIVCGIAVLEQVFSRYNDINYIPLAIEGKKVPAGTAIFGVSGNARTILKSERVALNLIQFLSGIATATSKFVEKISHTNAKILDTRKTLAGFRHLSKYAVWVGGGNNHRFCLDDGILIKDNHITFIGSITKAIESAKAADTGLKIEIECDTLEQVEEAIKAKPDIILLDNMKHEDLRKAVELGKNTEIKFEASGGVNLNNVKEVAETGVDFISVGALTHSVKAIDIGLDFSV